MSNFNYMDNVPVKIAEKYKPPPRIYQLPQSVAKKLNLPNDYYENNEKYSYDFQLERKILAKIPEYKRQRELERHGRQERREKREQEQKRRLNEHQKRLLGAVNYPNAEELSSSDSDAGNDGDNDDSDKIKKPEIEIKQDANWLARHCFNNILQPTVVSRNEDIAENNVDDALAFCNKYKPLPLPIIKTTGIVNNSGNSNKLANTFNYKDFEDDTSSPFDNIELKTINDLDILRQVLHNTQLTSNRENDELEKSKSETIENSKNDIQISNDMPKLENSKAALEKVNFSDINLGLEQQKNYNIPNSIYTNIGEFYLGSSISTLNGDTSSKEKCFVQPYINGIPDQHNYQVYHNQNYIYSPNCNSIVFKPTITNLTTTTTTTTRLTDYSNLNSVSSMMQYNPNNANNLLPNQEKPQNIIIQRTQLEDELQTSKSKSSPDLFQELREEIRNSEMRRRRSRNYSHNYDGSNEPKDDEENVKIVEESKPVIEVENDIYNKLEPTVQLLAKNISLMGFPLERVAKVARIYGMNDKKIVEHLISLTELLDLGFEEKRISEALLKFDNNKEKALELLIS